jgi:hypothetical protein
MEVGLHVKRSFFFSDSNQTWNSSAEFRKIPQHGTPQNFFGGEVVPCERTDRQTDRYDEDYSRFSHLCEEQP